jgi:hypothetical protein
MGSVAARPEQLVTTGLRGQERCAFRDRLQSPIVRVLAAECGNLAKEALSLASAHGLDAQQAWPILAGSPGLDQSECGSAREDMAPSVDWDAPHSDAVPPTADIHLPNLPGTTGYGQVLQTPPEIDRAIRESAPVHVDNPGDPVECSVHCPPTIQPQTSFLVQVWVYLVEDSDDAGRMAREATSWPPQTEEATPSPQRLAVRQPGRSSPCRDSRGHPGRRHEPRTKNRSVATTLTR